MRGETRIAQAATYLASTLATILGVCKAIHSNKYRAVKSSQPTRNIPLRLLPKQTPYSKTHQFLPHTLHYTTPTQIPPTRQSIHKATAAKSTAAHFTQLRLILHLYAPPVWHCTLNATQPSMNQRALRSLHYRSRTRAYERIPYL